MEPKGRYGTYKYFVFIGKLVRNVQLPVAVPVSFILTKYRYGMVTGTERYLYTGTRTYRNPERSRIKLFSSYQYRTYIYYYGILKISP